VRVRPGRTDDWTVLPAVFVAAGREAWPHILGEEALAALSPPDRWRDSLTTGDVLVLEDGGEPVGFAVLQPREVDAFYTHPSVWGRGGGRLLMAAALAELGRRGFTEAFLWTAEENDRPRRFYEQDGWQLEGTARARELRGSEFVELRYRRAIP
jgi:GNAT superfamily N-acetyltransferase